MNRYCFKTVFFLWLLIIGMLPVYTEDLTDDAESVHTRLEKILQDPVYHYTNPLDSVPASTPDLSFLGNLLNFLSNPMTIVVLLVVFGFFVVIVILLVRKFSLSIHHGNSVSVRSIQEEDYLKLLAQVPVLYQQGEYKTGVSLLVAALLSYYHKKGVLKITNGMTNREYIRILADQEEAIFLKEIIYRAEKVVFTGETLCEEECYSIYEAVKKRTI